MMQRWMLFRHGLATHSQFGYGEATLTARLLPEAEQDVIHLAGELKKLPQGTCYCSPVPRCVETMQIVKSITDCNKPVYDLRLQDRYQEDWNAFAGRVRSFMQEHLSHDAEPVLWICSHGAVIAAMTEYLRDGQMTEKNNLLYPPPAGLVVVESNH